MKLVVLIVSVSLIVLERHFPSSLALLMLGPPVIFALLATIHRVSHGFSYLNELPNILRILFASIGAALIGFLSPLLVLLGFVFVLLGVFANDEVVRRLYRQKGVIVLTGIDATGKSSHARTISSWLRSKGTPCQILKFDRYLFLERLSWGMRSRKSREKALSSTKNRIPPTRTNVLSLFRPYVALFDNVVFYILEALPCIVKGKYVVCDRFIWDNCIKHKALGYNTPFLSRLSTLIKPPCGIVFDVPAEVAFERVEKRGDHLRYSTQQYETERKEFGKIAGMLGYAIIETGNESIQQTRGRLETWLADMER